MTTLDASALLALLFREPGHERVAAVLDDCCISSVNLAEVLGRSIARDGHNPVEAARRIASSAVETVPFVDDDAALAVALIPRTMTSGLSLGGRACLALAIQRQAPAMTSDRSWSDIDVSVTIVQIRA